MTFSSRKTFLVALLTFISVLGLNAQTFKGKIISSKGGAPIEFANVMVKTTTIGAASNEKGEFFISMPKNTECTALVITAVGFTKKEIKCSELDTKKVNIIALTPVEYNIDEVDVEAESKILYGVIKKCSQSISANYIMSPYTCNFIYSQNNKEATGTISDAAGYKRTSFRGSLRQVSYQFDDRKDTISNTPYFDGKTNMEDLLSYDLMRTVGNIIDIENVYDFQLKYDVNNTDPSLWVIHFAAEQPGIHNTGDAHATHYEGELYIVKESFAISQINVRGKSSQRSIHGKSIMVSNSSSNTMYDFNYEASIYYSNKDGKYRLDEIKMKENFIDKDNKAHSVSSGLKIAAQQEEYTKIEGRDYFVRNL